MSDRFYVKGARIKDKCNPDELLVIGDVCDLLNELNNKNKELREENQKLRELLFDPHRITYGVVD